MSYLTKMLKQDIVYWAFSSRDEYGTEIFAAPVEIKGRWEKSNEKFLDGDGNEVVSSSVVFLTQDVSEGDWVFLGKIADIASSEGSTDPVVVTGAEEVRRFNKTPDHKGTSFERKALL